MMIARIVLYVVMYGRLHVYIFAGPLLCILLDRRNCTIHKLSNIKKITISRHLCNIGSSIDDDNNFARFSLAFMLTPNIVPPTV